MATKTILLLGGHGKVSLLLTPKLVSRSWNLFSVIRNPAHKSEILEAGKHGPGKVKVLVESLEDVKSEQDAQRIVDLVKPDWVIWSAGAGGKGGSDRTYAIDRDACIHFIRSCIATPSVSKFLLVSASSIRRNRAAWFDDADWTLVQKMKAEVMPHYYKAKLKADDVLTVLGEERMQRDKGFAYIDLRPGSLIDEEESGKVSLGKTKVKGSVRRGDVAEVAARLLEKEGAKGWIDLLGGDEDVGEAVERVVKEGINSIDGEDLEAMKRDL
ncbi:hypothetical protein B7494_g7622 [Chlorociboria aeruginascens]|nr:hypothetical protein B7494_g7622 [Chlorociboria aeruginascens]